MKKENAREIIDIFKGMGRERILNENDIKADRERLKKLLSKKMF
jgi:hypothetical protein